MTPCEGCPDSSTLASEAEAFETPRLRAFANDTPSMAEVRVRVVALINDEVGRAAQAVVGIGDRCERANEVAMTAISVFPELKSDLSKSMAQLNALVDSVQCITDLAVANEDG